MAVGDESLSARFAARSLDIDPGSTPEQKRVSLLRLLRDNDYQLDPVSHDAAAFLSGHLKQLTPRLTLAATRDEESRLKQEIETFAASYFNRPTSERRERWSALLKTCSSHESLLERLHWLGRGLDIDKTTVSSASPLVNRLISHVLLLYTRENRPRAVFQRGLVHSLWSDPAIKTSDIKRALKVIRTSYGSLTPLVPEYLTALSRPRGVPLRYLPARVLIVLSNKSSIHPLIVCLLGILFGLIAFAVSVTMLAAFVSWLTHRP